MATTWLRNSPASKTSILLEIEERAADTEKFISVFPDLPFLVVITTTPLDALEPYTAVALASFSTSIDSISAGLRKFNGLVSTPVEELSSKKPSTTKSG